MSRIHPGPEVARLRHRAISPYRDEAVPPLTSGWCLPCYEAGAFTLASGPDHTTCLLHRRPLDERAPAGAAFGIRADPPSRRVPRGRAARDPGGPSSGPGRTRRPRTAARARARALARGLARARRRVEDGGYRPHPGWRNFIDADYQVITGQLEALRHIERLVEDEDWRSDKRASWSQILRRLALHMDWETGLISGLTAERLGAAGGRAGRTVSRVLAWARDIGLLVVVETGASAEFLGTERGRTPTYALVAHSRLPAALTTPDRPSALGSSAVEESGDLPISTVGIKPLPGGTRPRPTSHRHSPTYTVPDTPSARNAATLTLLSHLGLGGRQGGRIEIWRARALLKPWWDAGANIAALLHAIEYHPDRPGCRRGDVGRGATDALRIVGARLRPWRGRLGEIPAAAVGQMMRHDAAAAPSRAARPVPLATELLDRPAGSGARLAAREALRVHLDQLRARRTQHTDPGRG